jgi:iron(III) transport system substrate-binding protein
MVALAAAPVAELAICSGCRRDQGDLASSWPQVVVYTALDRGFSEPILARFTELTGIEVAASYDTESTKTVGLANRIRAESARPRCDVFWNNEILNTIRLKEEGLLAPTSPKTAAEFDEQWKDPEGYWYGFAARARVLIVNRDLLPEDDFPTSIHSLADEKWRGRTAIAKPLFGTTATHVACLLAELGRDDTVAFLDAIKRNEIQIHSGNKGVAEAVAAGAAAFGLTDTDDAIIELEAGRPVRIVYPDAVTGGMGALFLPNTVALVKGAPHPTQGQALIEYLVSREVEERLANGPSAQIPLRKTEVPAARVQRPGQVKPMTVDFAAAADLYTDGLRLVETRFLE